MQDESPQSCATPAPARENDASSRPSPFAVPGDRDEPLAGPDSEEKARHLWENLIEKGQRLAVVTDGPDGKGKVGMPFRDCFDPALPYWRNVCRRHVSYAPAQVDLHLVKRDRLASGAVDHLVLGAYFGGVTDMGNNVAMSYTLDCDVEGNDGRRLMELAIAALPEAMFFANDNGKWHAHGRLTEARPARRVRLWLLKRLPAELHGIEIFPKSASDEPLEGYRVGNYIRLPFSPETPYEPVGGLRPIVAAPADAIPTAEEVAAESAERSLTPDCFEIAREDSGGRDARADSPDVPQFQREEWARNYAGAIGVVRQGDRHRKTFAVAACCLKNHGLPSSVAREITAEFNRGHCSPPLDESEVDKQVRDAATYASGALFSPASGAGTTPSTTSAQSQVAGARKSQAATLVELVASEGATLFHSKTGCEPHAVVLADGCKQTMRLRGSGFRRWLSGLCYRRTGAACGSQTMQDVMMVLEAKAVHEGDCWATHVRVAPHLGNVYLDMGDDKWRVVEIAPGGWRVLEESPVRFVRARSALALPEPARGGALAELRSIVNCPEEGQWAVVLAWLVGCLNPNGPYAVLAVNGEQASAKSTLARMLRALVDPARPMLRCEPRDARDLMIGAAGWIYALDNLSGVQPWLSDGLCRLSTGSGYATRELYSDDGETVFDCCRPILVNGIEEVATRSDLLDRCLSVCLPAIRDEQRAPESALWAEFERLRPRLLGSLLDGAVAALAGHDSVRLDRLPRMADHARWAVAAERALGIPDGSVLSAIHDSREVASAVALESSPVAAAVLGIIGSGKHFRGTASELLQTLGGTAPGSGDPGARRPAGWPTNPRALSSALRRLAPNLRGAGVEVSFSRSGATRLIILRGSTRRKRIREQQASGPQVRLRPIIDGDPTVTLIGGM